MNGRKAAKLAAKKIEELEHYNARCKADIQAYNEVIQRMIKGECPCKYCEEYNECQLTEKDVKACEQWWLAFTPRSVEEGENDSEGLPVVGFQGRA